MGRLGLGTGATLKTFTSLPDLAAVSDQIAQAYVDRAEAWLDRNGPYFTEIAGYREDMTVATYKTAQLLWVRAKPQFILSQTSNFQSEQIGGYRYTRPANKNQLAVLDPMLIDPEIYDIVRNYQRNDTYSTTTIVFKQFPADKPGDATTLDDPSRHIRDYKDLSDWLFDIAEDSDIVSRSSQARMIL
jgi:hypothetical protein